MENLISRRDRLLLLALALAVAFPFLGSFGLLEPDEGRFAQIGREMAAGGDYLVPKLNGIEQFYKPPFVYWITAAGYRLFGISEWTARLPSALSFAGVIWLTGWMGWRLGGRRVGWIAALILGSMLEPYALGRQITLDMSLTFWVTAALACLVGIGTGVRGKFIGYLFFLCMGLGFLAKGPMAWVVPGAAAVMWCWAARKAGQKLSLPWKSGILLTLGVALSWFVGVCLKYPELWGYFLGYELVERFASTTHGRSKPWWFFLPILAMGTIPWTGFLPGLVVRAWEKMKGGALAPAQWALGAAVVIPFVVVSCSGSKLLTYILPIYAPLALALAIWLGGGSSGKWIRMGWFFALAVLLLFGPSLWLVRYLWVEAAAATPSSIYLIMGMVVGLGLVGGWWGGLRKAGLGWRVGVVGVGSLFVWHGACLQMERVNDLLGRQASVRPLARLAEKHMPERIFIYRARAAGFLFALNREAWINRADADVVVDPSSSAKERLFEKPEDLRRGLATGQKVEGITLRHVFRDEFDPTQWEIVGRAGEFFLVRAYGGGK